MLSAVPNTVVAARILVAVEAQVLLGRVATVEQQEPLRAPRREPSTEAQLPPVPPRCPPLALAAEPQEPRVCFICLREIIRSVECRSVHVPGKGWAHLNCWLRRTTLVGCA